MPPGGWPPPGSSIARDLRCDRHLRTEQRWQGLGADIGTGLAFAFSAILLAAGFVLTAVLGQNYGPCQNAVIASLGPATCRSASLAHWGGIIALATGGVVLLTALISAIRN